MSMIKHEELCFPLTYSSDQQAAIDSGLSAVGTHAIVPGGVLIQAGNEYYAVFEGWAGLCICQRSEDLSSQATFEYLPVHRDGNAVGIFDKKGQLSIAHLVRCVKFEGRPISGSWYLRFWHLMSFSSEHLHPKDWRPELPMGRVLHRDLSRSLPDTTTIFAN